MGTPTREWDVRRRGGTVRVDMSSVGSLSNEECDSILAGIEDLLHDGEVSIVQVQGPIPGNEPPGGLARILEALGRLSERYDTQSIIGPV